jgi:S1-C subfamily serine protease
MVRGVLSVLLVTAAPLASQSAGARRAHAAVVAVNVLGDSDWDRSTGILLGARGDTVYVVTAAHVVSGGRRVAVQLRDEEDGRWVERIEYDPEVDVAVLAVHAPNVRRLPALAPPRPYAFLSGSRVYALTCARWCWGSPEPVEPWYT